MRHVFSISNLLAIAVDLGMAAVGGPALSAVNVTSSPTDALRDKSPTEFRLMNFGLLMNDMGVSPEIADAFLNNNAISPTTRTILVAAWLSSATSQVRRN